MDADFLTSHEGTKARRHEIKPAFGISVVILVLFLFFRTVSLAAPADLWPPNIKPLQLAEWEKQAATERLAPELKPAVQFQKTFLKILPWKPSKAQPLEPDWVKELQAFIAADREDDPVAHGVAEVARAWFARAQMQKIDAALLQYYRQNVRFPEPFSAIEPSLPEPLRRDPWGQPWAYQPRAPQGFAKLTGQRYQLGPARFPELGPLSAVTGNRKPAAPAWKITPHQIGGKRTLEFRLDGSSATFEAGGMAAPSDRLLYIGEHWALLASPDQLFAVTF